MIHQRKLDYCYCQWGRGDRASFHFSGQVQSRMRISVPSPRVSVHIETLVSLELSCKGWALQMGPPSSLPSGPYRSWVLRGVVVCFVLFCFQKVGCFLVEDNPQEGKYHLTISSPVKQSRGTISTFRWGQIC